MNPENQDFEVYPTSKEDQDPEGDLQARLDEALREKEQFHGLAQRAQADLANFKRRVDEEREDLQQRLKNQIVVKLLDVTDDFERALAHVPLEDAEESWVQGVVLINQKLWSLLETEGVTRVDALNKPFDPWEHEALYHQETDSFPEGQVVEVFRQGYKLKDKMIRPAQVVVAKRFESDRAN